MLQNNNSSLAAPLKRHPSDASDVDLTVLTNFIAHVLAHTNLPAALKEDVFKVVESLRFIKANIAYIDYAVRYQQTPGHQKTIFANSKDQSKGVIRDFEGTSLHISIFDEANEAITHLMMLVTSVEHAIESMQAKNKLDSFTEKFLYDANTGCIEKRTASALKFAAEVESRLSEPLQAVEALDDLFSQIAKTYEEDVLDNWNKTLVFFKPYLGQFVLYQQQVVTLTETLITTYLEQLGQSLEEAQERLKTQSDAFTGNTQVRIGYHHMIQFIFDTPAPGVQWVQWLKAQSILSTLSIHKARHDNQGIVRLTQDQYTFIYGKEAYQALLSKYNTSNPVQKTSPIQQSHPNRSLEALKNKLISKAKLQSETIFIALIDKCSIDALNQALIMVDNNGWNPLKTAARNQSEAGFTALIDKCSADALNQALIMVDNEGWNALKTAARYQSEAGFIALIDKYSIDVLNQALIMVDNDGWNALKTAARNQSEAGFIALIDKCSADALNQALTMVDKKGWNALMTAARYQSEAGFIALIDKCSADALNQALIIADTLSMVASEQTDAGFKALVKKCSANALNQALTRVDNEGWNALMTAARYQSGAGLIALIDKCTAPALSQALVIITKGGWNVLSTAARNQTETTLLFLVGRVNKHALIASLSQGLDFISQNHSKRFMKGILERLNPQELTQVLANATPQESLLAALVDLLLEITIDDLSHEAMVSTLQKLDVFIKAASPLHAALVSVLYARYQQGYPLPTQAAHLYFLMELVNNQPTTTTTTAFLNQLENQLIAPSSAIASPILSQADDETTKAVIDAFKAGDIVVKVMSDRARFEQHIKTLDNANYRIKDLRKPPSSNAQFKFNHRTGIIDSYSIMSKGQLNSYTRPQKTSVTLISPKGNTKLFGAITEKNTVALAYTASPSDDKAWLLKDRGTYEREWIGSLEEVKVYRSRMQDINFTDYEAFKQQVDNEAHSTNEVLTHLTKDRLKAVIVRHDTPEARTLARNYKVHIQKVLGISLPIIFYHSLTHTIKAYPLADQKRDRALLLLNHYLIQIEKRIQQSSLSLNSVFKIGYKPQIKHQAAQQLQAVLQGESPSSELMPYFPILNNGRLGEIYRQLLPSISAQPSSDLEKSLF